MMLIKNYIAQMKTGISPFYEPGLDDLLKKNLNNRQLFFTSNPKQALENADIIYIAVGTPTDENGRRRSYLISKRPQKPLVKMLRSKK